MQYKIVGNTMPAVEILFDQPGESMYTQSGGMGTDVRWCRDGYQVAAGGLFKGVGAERSAGESLFMANMIPQASREQRLHLPLRWQVRLCRSMSVAVRWNDLPEGSISLRRANGQLKRYTDQEVFFRSFGGEGFILEEISGKGMAFLGDRWR